MTNNLPQISDIDLKKILHGTVYDFQNEYPFYAHLFQVLPITWSDIIPTAAISYNSKIKLYEIKLNKHFMQSITKLERRAVFLHEVLHFLHQHMLRFDFVNKEERQLYNIATDMAINQYISNLPTIVKNGKEERSCIDVNDFKDDNGNPFPKFRPAETYVDLLKNNKQWKEDLKNKYGNGEGESEEKSFQTMDEHEWEQLSEEEKKDALDSAKSIIKRAVDKVSYDHNAIPDHVKDLIDKINTQIDQMDCKKILSAAIKKSVSSVDKRQTWSRPNRRVGLVAPGKKLGDLPKLLILNDTSGSISVTEMNQMLRGVDQFLKVGIRKCEMAFFHTNVYGLRRYKIGDEVLNNELESGGTDLEPVLKFIKQKNPDMAIIFTDGFYSSCTTKLDTEIIFIITPNGDINHPLTKYGKTFKLKSIL